MYSTTDPSNNLYKLNTLRKFFLSFQPSLGEIVVGFSKNYVS